MKRISAYAKTVTALCAAALLAGCGTETDDGPEAGCVAAYDDSYQCHSRAQDVSALDPVYSSRNAQECSEFVRNLDDGRYWLTGTDESGEPFDLLLLSDSFFSYLSPIPQMILSHGLYNEKI